MSRRRAWPIVAIICGTICSLFGLSLVSMYVYSAVIDRLGEPDQSLLFWLIPFLLIGLAASIAGIVMITVGVASIRRHAAEGASQRPVEQAHRAGGAR